MINSPAPDLNVTAWLNTPEPIFLHQLRGKVVVIEAFQMLCPGCVSHGLPQARLISQTFPSTEVQVIGLHCVFEHHKVQGTEEALAAFLHEYRSPFPIAIDTPSQESPVPKTMSALGLQGTPSLVIIDRNGVIRHSHFGRPDDMLIGAQIMQLVSDAHLKYPEKRQLPNTCAVDGSGCQ